MNTKTHMTSNLRAFLAGHTNREPFELIVESAYDGIMVTDAQHVIQYVNPAWQKLSGWTDEEVVGHKTPHILQSGEKDPAFYETLNARISKGDAFYFEITNKRKDGTLYEVEEVIVPIMSRTKTIIGYIGIQRDITERRKVEHELKGRIQELEHVNHLMIRRENRMIELKHDVEELKRKLGVE